MAVEIDAENDLSIYLSEISVLTSIGTQADPLAVSVGGKFLAAAFGETGAIIPADIKIFLEVPEGDLDATPTSMSCGHWTCRSTSTCKTAASPSATLPPMAPYCALAAI